MNDEENMCESVEEGHLITSFLRMRNECRYKLKCACERKRQVMASYKCLISAMPEAFLTWDFQLLELVNSWIA